MDLMLDIETMSTHPSRALVLSLAVVPFSLNLYGPMKGTDAVEPTFEAGTTWTLNITQQLLLGRRVDTETQGFWSRQPKEASDHWTKEPGRDVFECLQELRDIIKKYDARIWANGMMFDLGNMHTLYEDMKMEVPWMYNMPRDARTIYDLPQVRSRSNVSEKSIPHHPLWDCKEQIWRLWEHWPTHALVSNVSVKETSL